MSDDKFKEERLAIKKNLERAHQKLISSLGTNGVIFGDNEIAALIECVEEWLELEGESESDE